MTLIMSETIFLVTSVKKTLFYVQRSSEVSGGNFIFFYQSANNLIVPFKIVFSIVQMQGEIFLFSNKTFILSETTFLVISVKKR
jgi:hypothetical protein